MTAATSPSGACAFRHPASPPGCLPGLVASNGQDGLANDAGTEVYFDTPEVIGAPRISGLARR